MPSVPYKGYFDVTPSVNPTPRIGVNVPGEAFGTGIGRAIEGAGRDISRVGDEMAHQALTIQGYQNDTWLAQADADHMEKVGRLKEDFYQKEGQAAVDARPKYQADIMQAQKDALDSAPNPAVRRKLQQEIYRRTGYELVSAGSHAAQQAKVARDDANTRRLNVATKDFNPEDPDSGKRIDKAARTIGIDRGQTPEAQQDRVNEARARGALSWFKASAANDPEKARKYFEEIKGELPTEVREESLRYVQRAEAGVQSRKDATYLTEGISPENARAMREPLLKKAQELAEKHKDNPEYQDQVVQRTENKLTIMERAHQQTQQENANTLRFILHGKSWNDQVISRDALDGDKADPQVKALFNTLDVKQQDQIIREANHIAKLNIPENPELYKKLQDMGTINVATPEQLNEFRQMNLLTVELPRRNIEHLLNMQRNLIKQVNTDTDLPKYLGWVQHYLKSVRGAPLAADTSVVGAQKYERFKGEFDRAITDFKQTTGAPPGVKDAEDIARTVIRDVYTGPEREHWYSPPRPHAPRYAVPLPKDDPDVKEFVDMYTKRSGGAAPAEATIRHWYLKKKQFEEVPVPGSER